ncbi:unnamed protein product [Paramecium pentaurelia]|uniref:Uncharacterized protein n=1 Tax=Paramecium pentaurelia TaxID=43138 RepID=A0A8S1W7G6_9CILI|nr:unnamed protein product [Paramecium pentaurelia]
MFILIIDFIRTYLTQISLFQIPNYIIIKISFLSNQKKIIQINKIMQVKKVNTLIGNSELLNLNLNPSFTSSLKPNKQSHLQFSPALQRKNNHTISYHQPPNKVHSESVPQQTSKSIRGRSITLNKLDLSPPIQPIPLQSLQKQLFIHQLKFVNPFEKTKQGNQQSRYYIKKQIYNQKNNTGFQNNQKLNSVQNIRNHYRPQSSVGLKQFKQNIYLNQQSYKKQSFKQFTQIIPKQNQEYTKKLIKQLPKFLDIDNEKCYDNQQKFLTEYEFGLNMSEIQEINEDGLSSNALSTFYNKVF